MSWPGAHRSHLSPASLGLASPSVLLSSPGRPTEPAGVVDPLPRSGGRSDDGAQGAGNPLRRPTAAPVQRAGRPTNGCVGGVCGDGLMTAPESRKVGPVTFQSSPPKVTGVD